MRILILALAMFGCSETWVEVTPCEDGRSACVDETHVERCIGNEWVETDCAAQCAGTAFPTGRCDPAVGFGQSSCGCYP